MSTPNLVTNPSLGKSTNRYSYFQPQSSSASLYTQDDDQTGLELRHARAASSPAPISGNKPDRYHRRKSMIASTDLGTAMESKGDSSPIYKNQDYSESASAVSSTSSSSRKDFSSISSVSTGRSEGKY